MNRVLRLCLCLVVLAVAMLGCQQGVTDVGNPNIVDQPPAASPSMQNPGPTLGQLIGGYSLPSPVASEVQPSSDGSGGSSSPALPSCRADANATQSITPTANPTQVVLNHFLDYGTATENILATYDARSGAIALEIADPAVAIASCTGTAKDSGGIVVNLQCKARASGDPDCQVTYGKN